MVYLTACATTGRTNGGGPCTWPTGPVHDLEATAGHSTACPNSQLERTKEKTMAATSTLLLRSSSPIPTFGNPRLIIHFLNESKRLWRKWGRLKGNNVPNNERRFNWPTGDEGFRVVQLLFLGPPSSQEFPRTGWSENQSSYIETTGIRVMEAEWSLWNIRFFDRNV